MAHPQPNSNGCWIGSLMEMPSIYTLAQVNKLLIGPTGSIKAEDLIWLTKIEGDPRIFDQ